MVSIPPPRGWQEQLLRERAEKDRQLAIDPQTPLSAAALAVFRGLEYFRPDPRHYFVGPIHLYAQPQRFEIPTTSGRVRPCEKLGWITFEIDGTMQTLQIYRLADIDPRGLDNGLFVPFRDGTSGQETYPAGRYLDLQGPPVTGARGSLAVGPYVLDFNAAYNPSCAYGAAERFNCPVTPPENRLPVRIEAGERGYHPQG
jgi:uncharacterized protein (DUF1684 family)